MSEKPEDNPKLKELKRKWDEDYFGLDSAGVYGVEEAIDEAAAHLAMYDKDRSPPKGGAYKPPQAGNNEISRELGRERKRDARYTESADNYMDRKFGHKTCRICSKKARNDPCDTCYKMVRAAAEWTDEQCIMEVYPCAMCDTEVYSTICGTCMDIMLGEE